MIFFVFLTCTRGHQPRDWAQKKTLSTKYGPDLKSDTSLELFQYKCLEFYSDRRESSYGVNVTYVGEGAQGVVYRCETFDPNSEVPYVAIKIYKNPMFVSKL